MGQAPAETQHLGNLIIGAPATEQTYFVVDGQQRTVSFANALHPEGARRAPFSLSYDLVEESFTVRASASKPWLIPLPVLFDLKIALNWFADYPEISEHFSKATQVTKILRQYQVPEYVVRHHDEKVLRDIFDRLNNYGKRLT